MTKTEDGARRAKRSDGRRNFDRLLIAARDSFTNDGVDASLDEIARKAGVANATLYRHFPSREALLGAVFQQQVQALCARADDLLASPSPDEALASWLQALVAHVSTYRGLATWLMSGATEEAGELASCRDSIRAAGSALLTRAQRAGVIRADLTAPQLLRLVNAIALSTEQAPDDVDHLLSVLLDGARRREPTPKQLNRSGERT